MRLIVLGLMLALAMGCSNDAPPHARTTPRRPPKASEEMMRQHQQEFKDRKLPKK